MRKFRSLVFGGVAPSYVVVLFNTGNMKPYYILRLFPPLGVLKKYKFDNLESLVFTLSNLYDTLNIDQLDLTEPEKNRWKKDPLNYFSEAVLITRVDPELCVDYTKKFNSFRNIEKIKIEYVTPLNEATA